MKILSVSDNNAVDKVKAIIFNEIDIFINKTTAGYQYFVLL
jgi:hypothetical protein